MIQNYIDLKVLMITISLTIGYMYITTENDIIFKKNVE